MIVYDKDGITKQTVQSNSEESQIAPTQDTAPDLKPNEVKYYFDNWTGSDNVLILCQNCIQELESIINDGISNGFITG
jgi:hypothetical protein